MSDEKQDCDEKQDLRTPADKWADYVHENKPIFLAENVLASFDPMKEPDDKALIAAVCVHVTRSEAFLRQFGCALNREDAIKYAQWILEQFAPRDEVTLAS